MKEHSWTKHYGSIGTADEAGMPVEGAMSAEVREIPVGTASVFITTCSLVNVMIGAGVLAFPAQFARAGWYMAPPMLILVAVVMAEVGILMNNALQRIEEIAITGREFTFGVQATKMEDVGEAAFGAKGRLFVSSLTNVFFLFICGAFLILIGMNMQILFENTVPYRVWVLAVLAIATPVALLQDISMIAKASVVGVGCSVVYVFSIVFSGTMNGTESPQYRYMPVAWTTLGSVFAVMMFGFMYVMVVPPLRAGMKEREKMPQAIVGAMAAAFVIYSLCGLCGYYGWGNTVQGNVVASMGGPYDKIMAMAVVSNLMVTFPLLMGCVSCAFECILDVDYSAVVRVALVGTSAAIGLFCPFFMEVVGLVSSFLGVIVSIVIPIACYWKLRNPKEGSDIATMKMAWHTVILLISGLVFFFGMSDSIADLRSAFAKGGKNPFTWDGFFAPIT